MKAFIFFVAICSAIIFGCSKTGLQLKNKSHDAGSIFPPGFTDSLLLILPESDDFAAIPQDPRNPLTKEKVELGKLLFHETKLGGNPKMAKGLYTFSCASCHHAEAGFQSAIVQAIGEGGEGFGIRGEGRVPSTAYMQESVDVSPLHSPSVMNTAYQEVLLWNGSMGSSGVNTKTQYAWTGPLLAANFLGYQGLETVAIAGLQKHRFYVDSAWLYSNAIYQNLFYLSFPELPEDKRITTITTALAMAAYERTVLASQAPFQKYLNGDNAAMSANQKAGAKLFFGKAKCSNCHQGPALSSMSFYALGINDMQNGVHGAINIFNNAAENKGRGGFTGRDQDMYKFKVPQLYNLKDAQFFGHGSTFTSVREVVEYINNAVPQNKAVPFSQFPKNFEPLYLTDDEINKLTNFIENALYDPNLLRYVPPFVPSGNCIPNNDANSRKDRGCG